VSRGQVLDVVIIIFGLYLLMSFVTSLTSLSFYIFAEENQFASRGSWILMTSVYSVILLGLCCLFLFKRNILIKLLSSDTQSEESVLVESLPCYARLSFWIQILGLYFLISSGSKAVGQLAIVVSTRSQYVSDHMWWHQTGHYLVSAIVAGLFIWKSKTIADFITKVCNTDT